MHQVYFGFVFMELKKQKEMNEEEEEIEYVNQS